MTTAFLPFAKPVFTEASITAVAEVLRSGWVTTGPKLLEFEQALSAYFGRPTLSFANGTCTMEVALRLANIGPGDEVITTPLTWVATANVITQVGATVVFADIDPLTRNLSIDSIKSKLSPRTKAILPVHLAGLPCDLTAIYALAKTHNLRVIEDAAQAIGSHHQGQKVGSFGDFASFSFQANKNLTTAEGGCLVLPDVSYLPRAERLRLQGVKRLGVDEISVEEVGGKYNLTDIAAVLGLEQLSRLDSINAHRKRLAECYEASWDKSLLQRLNVSLPVYDWASSNWHLFQLVLNPDTVNLSRAQFITEMKTAGIGIGVHYPAAHLTELYRSLGAKPGDCPVAERVCQFIVSLPIHSAMSEADVARVVSATETLLKTHAR
jgi:dTDP-4-amino-4,6-dideoxygalactose transaminase